VRQATADIIDTKENIKSLEN